MEMMKICFEYTTLKYCVEFTLWIKKVLRL